MPDAESAGSGQQAGSGGSPIEPDDPEADTIWWEVRCSHLWEEIGGAYFAHWTYLEDPTEEELYRWPPTEEPESDDAVLEVGRCFLGFVTVEVGFWVTAPDED